VVSETWLQAPTGLLAALLVGATIQAQSTQVSIHSEFQRIDPFGEIVVMDRSSRPREILSPAVARNAYASFHLAITTTSRESYFLNLQTNPPNVARWTLYEQHFVQAGDAWIPDLLVEARYPFFGVMPNPDQRIPGQTTRVYLLDLWVPSDIEENAFRLEVLAKAGYVRVAPLEVRVLPVVVPATPAADKAYRLPGVEEPASAAARKVLEAYLSGREVLGPDRPEGVRAVIARNAVQDVALAMRLESRMGREQVRQAIRARLPKHHGPSHESGAEWYLQVRDYLYREAAKALALNHARRRQR
jgi:hypothetical protein